jgi:hypothetical protein
MPRSGGDAAPREYVARGQWPTGGLRKDAPVSAIYGQEFVNRLLKALEAKGAPSLRSIEREAKVSRRTVERVLAGEVLPDFGALARLEQWLEADLWPGRDLRGHGRTDRPT